MPMQCFIHAKVNFEKKTFLFLVLARNTIMLRHLIIYSLLHYLCTSRLREVKNKEKFQTFSYKSGHGRLREVVAYQRWLKPEVRLYFHFYGQASNNFVQKIDQRNYAR